jgi:hypothetical protein
MRVLILERDESGEIYAYIEDAEHHIVVNHNPHSGRSLENRVEINTDDECLVEELLGLGQWTSFLIKDFSVPAFRF